MNTFNGDAVLHAKMNGVDRKLDAALDFSMSNLSDPNARGLPEAFSIEADCSSLESNFIENFKPFHVSLIRSPMKILEPMEKFLMTVLSPFQLQMTRRSTLRWMEQCKTRLLI